MPDLTNFEKLGLSQRTLEALEQKGFENPTKIQEQCIPLLLKDQTDVIGQAQTGTGKTAAFGLPILETVDSSQRFTQAIILEPTRELAIQVAEEISSLTNSKELEVLAVYGGSSIEQQLRKLRKGVQIVVGTPGRVQDHLKRGSLNLQKAKFAVLDEADEMLDMGFIEDIDNILAQTSDDKRMLCFSATMPPQIMKLTSKYMRNPEIVRVAASELTGSLTEQLYFELRESEKLEALCRIIDMEEDFYAIVFCKTKLQCDDLGRRLQEKGYLAEALHGDLSQKQRELILNKMKKNIIKIIVATDVAARGIDINDLTHVINYSIPQAPETYVHRIGRTGRAGKKGTAITFITRNEFRKLSYIKRITKKDIEKGSIPSTKDIIAIKKKRILTKLESLIESPSENDSFDKIAQNLLEKGDAQTILAAVLSECYKNELDESKYSIISSPKNGREKSSDRISYFQEDGNVRLFIARGRKDGLDVRELVNYLIQKVGARNEDIQNVTIRDEFSFVTAPYEVAERIIHTINATSKSDKPIVCRAKNPDNPNGKRLSRGVREKDHDKGKYNRRGNDFKRKSHKEIQPYGSDSRDDENEWSTKPKKKKHYGKSIKKKSRKR